MKDNEVRYEQIHGVNKFNKTIKCSYFLVVLFIEGNGIHYIDDKKYMIKKNQVHFLFPGHHHHWETVSNTFAHKLVIGKDIFESFSGTDEFHFIRHNLDPIFKLSPSILFAVETEIVNIKRDIEFLEEETQWQKILNLRMDILASMMKCEAQKKIEKNEIFNSNPKLEEFCTLINANYLEQKKPNWYANQLCITPNYLNILCQKYLNSTATTVIQLRVLQEAKKLLKFTEKPIKEITYELGFETVSSFSLFFKKKCGFSPKEYRKA